MQQPYANQGMMPRQPQMGYAQPPPAPSGGSSAIVWVIAGVVLLCVVGAAIFFSMKSGPATQPPAGPSVEDLIAQIQAQTGASTPTPTPQTLAPLCPENVAPVLDADGKIYKNVCYAQSVNAKGPLVPSPVGQGGIPGAVGTDTSLSTSAPVIWQGKGGQSVPGITQGKGPTIPKSQAQRQPTGPSGVKYMYPEGVKVGTPIYAGQIGKV